jgi:predicted transposase/invertase (TIGR01784 family)
MLKLKEMVNTKRLNPFNDLAFKRIFGQDQNKSVLIDFLNGLLLGERHIVDVTYGDKEQVLDEEQSGSMIYDVYCTSDTGEKFIVEMQNKSHPHFIDRMVCYASRAIQRQLRKGEGAKYDIKAVYCIVFMNFKCEGIEDKVVSNVALCDMDTGRQISDLLRFVFIQLPLFNKSVDECESVLDKWFYVLRNMKVLEDLPEGLQCEAFKKLKSISDYSSLSEEEREMYDRIEDRYNDAVWMYNGAIEEGMIKGEAKGRAEGEASKAYSIAMNLKKMKFPVADISSATGLSIKEIDSINLN